MRSRLGSSLIAIISVAAAGCGTFANTFWLHDDEGGRRVYGGVRCDASVIQRSVANAVEPDERDPFTRDHHCKTALWTVLDLPLSFVGDTLVLPITLAATIERAQGDSEDKPDRE